MAEFNPKDEFKAEAPFRYAGKAISPGPIDKTLVKAAHLPVLFANGRIVAMTDEEADEYRAQRRDGKPGKTKEGETQLPALTDEQKAKVAELVANNDRTALLKLAGDAQIAEPEKLGNKPDIAEAIVRAQG